MSSSDFIVGQRTMVCAVCREVYTSPRLLPCHLSFCLHCLEPLEKDLGNVIPCPVCRAPARLPLGGVRKLQFNFHFTEEALKKARNVGSPKMCPVHAVKKVIFYCTLCEKAICMRCKMTEHEGHATEDLSEATVRRRKMIRNKLRDLKLDIKNKTDQLEMCKQSLTRVGDERATVVEQICAGYDAIVAMAARHRDQALKELEEMSDSLEKDHAADIHRAQNALDSLLQLQERALQALSTAACDTEVLQAEKDMRQEQGIANPLRRLV